MGKDTMETYLAEATKSVRKIISGGDRSQGTFAIARGKEESYVVFFPQKKDTKGARAKKKVQELKKLCNAPRFSNGTVELRDGVLYFGSIKGNLRGAELLKTLKKEFTEAPSPLPIILKNARILSQNEDGTEKVVGSGEKFNPKTYKKELRESILNDKSLNPQQRKKLMEDMKSLFDTLDKQSEQLSSVSELVEDPDSESDDFSEFQDIDPEELESEIQDLVSFFEAQERETFLSGSDLGDMDDHSQIQSALETRAALTSVDIGLEAPGVGENLGGFGDLAVLVAGEDARKKEDDRLRDEFIPEMNRLYAVLIEACRGQLDALNTAFASKDKHFATISTFVNNDMFKPHLDKMEGDKSDIVDPENQAIINTAKANLKLFEEFVRSNYRINTLDRRVEGVSFWDTLSGPISSLNDYLELSKRLAPKTATKG